MIVIQNPNARTNAGERAFIAHQRGKDGVLLVNFLVGGGGPRKPGREIDGILLLPHGIFAVEVKYTQASGELDSPLNDTWSIGGVENPFSTAHRSPATQADQAAKILATVLDNGPWAKAYVTPLVAIHGNVTIPEQARWVGTVGVATVEHLGLLIKQARTKRLRASDVGLILEHLGVSKSHVPALDRLLDEGFVEDVIEGEQEEATRPRAESGSTKTPRVVATQPPPRPPGRQRPWLLRPIGKGERARTTLLAITTTVALVGVWQLCTGTTLALMLHPAPGESFYLYGPWAGTGAPLGSNVTPAAMLTGALMIVFEVAAWLRFRVGALTPVEVGAFLLSVFGLIALAPAIFTAWQGALITFVLYVTVWPLGSVAVRSAWGPLGRSLDAAWNEYEV